MELEFRFSETPIGGERVLRLELVEEGVDTLFGGWSKSVGAGIGLEGRSSYDSVDLSEGFELLDGVRGALGITSRLNARTDWEKVCSGVSDEGKPLMLVRMSDTSLRGTWVCETKVPLRPFANSAKVNTSSVVPELDTEFASALADISLAQTG